MVEGSLVGDHACRQVSPLSVFGVGAGIDCLTQLLLDVSADSGVRVAVGVQF